MSARNAMVRASRAMVRSTAMRAGQVRMLSTRDSIKASETGGPLNAFFTLGGVTRPFENMKSTTKQQQAYFRSFGVGSEGTSDGTPTMLKGSYDRYLVIGFMTVALTGGFANVVMTFKDLILGTNRKE